MGPILRRAASRPTAGGSPAWRLAAVVAVLGACTGGGYRWTEEGGSPRIRPRVISDRVFDDPDDPALWIHPTEPAASLVLGTDKGGHLLVFDLDGKMRRDLSVSGLGRMNNVDVEYGVDLGDERADIAVATERSAGALRVYRLPDMKELVPGGLPVFVGEPPKQRLPMGVALYRRPRDGAVFVFVSRVGGFSGHRVWQYRLVPDDAGGLELDKVRELAGLVAGSEIEALAVDDELGYLYCADEATGIRKYAADPEAPEVDLELALFGTTGFVEDREGISIYDSGAGRGFILVSDQAANRFRVFPREGAQGAAHRHPEIAVLRLQTLASDGSEVTARRLGEAFPDGLFVAMSDHGNFHYYAWPDLGLAAQKGEERDAPSAASADPAPAIVDSGPLPR